MSRSLPEWNHEPPPALVLLSAGTISPLWDPDLAELIEDLEERLDDVHVTSATLDGRHPRLEDALAAARFSGASMAVIAVPADLVSPVRSGSAEAGEARLIPAIPVRCPWSADDIVAAYERTCALAADLESVAAGG